MSYQPPGPYPVPPGRPPAGSTALRTPPSTVQRAFTFMLVGAGLAGVNAVLDILLQPQIQQKV
ncbi:MAG TPA: hypothetical protein VH372_17550, partial [Actinospica sp.]|nr:hypothetical protein [Actinospica sp.]